LEQQENAFFQAREAIFSKAIHELCVRQCLALGYFFFANNKTNIFWRALLLFFSLPTAVICKYFGYRPVIAFAVMLWLKALKQSNYFYLLLSILGN